jgi:cullin 1
MWSSDDSCPEYMRKAEKSLQEEQARVGAYLHNSTEEKLLRRCEMELLEVRQSKVLDKEGTGCEALLRDDGRNEDLSRMYRLWSRIPDQKGLAPIAEILKNHIVETGTAHLKTHESGGDVANYIQGLVVIHDKYYDKVTTCFQSNPLFHKAMKEAFEVFVNQDVGKASTAQLLSNFLDDKLSR